MRELPIAERPIRTRQQNVTARILKGACLCMPLAGCASWFAPQPPQIPTPAAIRTYLESVNGLTNGAAATLGTVDGVTVATNGYTLVDTQCDAFFSAVFRMSFDNGFNRQEVTLAGALAAGTLAAAGASAKSIAITALAGTFLGASLDNFQNFALLTPYPNQVHKLVQSALSTYAQSAPPNDATKMKDVPTALYYVAGYASLCTYAGIGDLVAQALQAAKPVDKAQSNVSPTTPPPPPIPGAPLVVVPGQSGLSVRPQIEIQ
jgi:hypothetical protein